MASRIFDVNGLKVTSYCGPAITDEHTRVRLQFGEGWPGLGYSEVLALLVVLVEWLHENKPGAV